MSVRYEIEEFFDDTVDRTRDFGFGVANAARRAFCAGWSAVPGAIVPNPGDSFVRGLASSMCRDFPQPPAPAPPFTGGQCPAIYSVRGRVDFRVRATGQNFSVGETGLGVFLGPVSGSVRRNGEQYTLFVRDGNGVETPTIGSSAVDNEFVGGGIVSTFRTDGQPDNCGNPAPVFEGPTFIEEGDQVTNENITVEGDRNISIPVSIAPIFEEDVCIGQFAFCVDVGDVRVTLDLGGVTINLPGTGGGNSDGGGDGGNGDTITNIDTKVTNIQEQQEECCAAIIQSISSFRNRATELLNEAELQRACIVGLIRNSTNLVPRFVGPASIRASGSSGLLGSVRYVQPSRGDSCFLVIEVTPTPGFQGKRYKILDDGQLVEASFGHAELVFLDGTTFSPSETGIRTLSNRKTFVWFPYVSSGNAIRLSLAAGLDYEVRDPGFRWSPSDLPTCEEVIDPGP